jgi:predicted Zn finger-like uncharacterized protein
MRFFCDRCKTRYTIADEKVRGKVLKIRCKNCGNVITVSGSGGRRSAKGADTSSAEARARSHRRRSGAAVGRPPTSERPAKGGAAARITFKAPKGTAAEPAVKPPADGAGDPKTVVSQPGFDISSIRQEARAAQSSRSAESAAQAASSEPEEWYLADDHGQYGPMTFSELTARIKRGEPGPNPEVWRDGFDDWQDPHHVPELRPYLKHLPPPRAAQAGREKRQAPAVDVSEEQGEAGPTLEDMGPAGAAATPASAASSAPKRVAAHQRRGAAGGAGGAAGVEGSFFKGDGLESGSPSSADLGQGSGPHPMTSPAEADVGGQTAGGEDPGLGGPAPLSSGGMAPIGAPRDSSKPYVIIFAALGAVVALALVVLVVYIIVRDQQTTQKQPQPPRVAKSSQTGQATNPAKGDKQPRPPARGSEEQTGEEEGDEELVMDEVEITLPRGERSRRTRKHRAGASRRARESRESRPRQRSTSGLGSSFGSPGVYGGLGSRSVGGSRRRLKPTPDRPRSGSSRKVKRGRRPVTKPEVMAVVRRNVHRLKRCYEKAARLHPKRLKRVRMKIRFRVSASGRVTSVKITPGKYRGLSLGSCITSSIRRWKFPKSTKSYGSVFPVSFVGRSS